MRPELQDIVDEAARVLGGATTLEDRTYGLIAFSAQHGPVDAVREASILQRSMPKHIEKWFEQFGFADSPVPLRTPADRKLGIMSRICFPARCHGSNYGYLWALDDHHDVRDPVIDQIRELADHAGSYLAQLTRQREQDRLLVADLLGTDVESMHRAAIRLGDDGRMPRDAAIVSVVVGCWDDDMSTGPRLNPSSLPANVLSAEGDRSVTIVAAISGGDAAAEGRRLAATIVTLYASKIAGPPARKVVAGIGACQASVVQARDSWLQARTSARVAAEADGVDAILAWDDLGIYRLLAAAPDGTLRATLVTPAIGRLLASADDETVRTLRVYLDRCGRAQDAADALSIHRQTLYYRLEKAERIMGVSLGDGRQRSAVHAALLLHPIIADT